MTCSDRSTAPIYRGASAKTLSSHAKVVAGQGFLSAAFDGVPRITAIGTEATVRTIWEKVRRYVTRDFRSCGGPFRFVGYRKRMRIHLDWQQRLRFSLATIRSCPQQSSITPMTRVEDMVISYVPSPSHLSVAAMLRLLGRNRSHAVRSRVKGCRML